MTTVVITIIIHYSPLIATINPLSTIIRPSNEGPTVSLFSSVVSFNFRSAGSWILGENTRRISATLESDETLNMAI